MLIPFPDYKRIFLTIYTILKNEDGDINKAGTYFSIIGAYLLKRHYQIDAKARMGVALYRFDEEEKNILAFAVKNGDKYDCSEDGFHAWIEADGWMIDFMAPLFRDKLKSMSKSVSCESRMFQKPLDAMCSSVEELSHSGDFLVMKDENFSNEIIDDFFSYHMNMDLAEICSAWYRKPPFKMAKVAGIVNNKGQLRNISLRHRNILGSW